MNIGRMDTPSTREEFEYRLHLLQAGIHKEKVHFDLVPVLIESLYKVRAMGNGRIDLLTIDEPVRLQANMMVQMEHLFPEDMLGHEANLNKVSDKE